jgi:SAM-dependent methyltransferase
VLDAGCGIGTTAAQIARRFDCQVVALDINEANLNRARCTVEQIGVDDRVAVRRGDIEQLEFDDERFDVVLVEAVTMFVDRKRAAAEVARVCRRGGRVVDHEFIWRKPPPPGPRDLFMGRVCPGIDFDTEADWIGLYREAGLDDLRTTTGPFAMMTPARLSARRGRRRQRPVRRQSALPAGLRAQDGVADAEDAARDALPRLRRRRGNPDMSVSGWDE